jgi:hypothetical protein
MMPPPTMTIDLGEVAASAAAEEDDVMGDILVIVAVVSDIRTSEGVVGDVVVARHMVVNVVVLSVNLLIKTLQREQSIGRLRTFASDEHIGSISLPHPCPSRVDMRVAPSRVAR